MLSTKLSPSNSMVPAGNFYQLAWMIWLSVLVLHLAGLAIYWDGYSQFIANTLSPDGELLSPFSTLARLTFCLALLGFAYPTYTMVRDRLADQTGIVLLLTFYGILLGHLAARLTIFRGHPPEDGFLENMQAIIFFVGGCISIWAAILAAKAKGNNGTWLYALYGLTLIVIAMEEISWGQRIIGWQTPEGLAALNYQQETNIHNLVNPYIGTIWFVSFATLLVFAVFSSQIVSKLNTFLKLSDIHPINQLPEVQRILLLEFVLIILIVLGEGELAEEIFAITNLFIPIALVARIQNSKAMLQN